MSDAIAATASPTLADRIDAVLPQTQCTKCGFAGCRPYAEAIAAGTADIDRCPPGGARGIQRLSALTVRPVRPLNPANGTEGPLRVAVIDESLCIGCTLCIQACPVDAIAGAARAMHTVLPALCTGCDLCIPPCPMDCIKMIATDRAWTDDDAGAARRRFDARAARQVREEEHVAGRKLAKAIDKLAHIDQTHAGDPQLDAKKARVAAAIERARARRRDAAGTNTCASEKAQEEIR